MSELEFNKIVAKNIRHYLDRSELTQKELAKLLGVGQTSVYNWLNAIKIPRSDKIDAMCNIFSCKRADLLLEKPVETPAPDPLRAYYDRLEAFLQESPEHRALVDSAAHVRAEDAEIVRQLLARFADPDSAAPELPVLENVNKSLRTANNSCERANTSADEIELTAETLKRVTNSPEVLAEDAAYIKSRRNAEKKALSSSRTTSEGRKSG